MTDMLDDSKHTTSNTRPIQDQLDEGVTHRSGFEPTPYSDLHGELTWCAAEADEDLQQALRAIQAAGWPAGLAFVGIVATGALNVLLVQFPATWTLLPLVLIAACVTLMALTQLLKALRCFVRAEQLLTRVMSHSVVEVRGEPISVQTIFK